MSQKSKTAIFICCYLIALSTLSYGAMYAKPFLVVVGIVGMVASLIFLLLAFGAIKLPKT